MSLNAKSTKKEKKPTKAQLKKEENARKKKLEERLWILCRGIIRNIYPNECYTCPQINLQGSNWHTGHMWAKKWLKMHMKYDLRVLRPQCYRCNMELGGMGAVFFERMQKELSPKAMDDLMEDRDAQVEVDELWLVNKIAEYEKR